MRDDFFNADIARARLVDFMAAARDASGSERCHLMWELLGAGTHDDRIRAWQELRGEGLVPASAIVFLLHMAVSGIAERRARALPEYRALDARRRAMERAAGFADGSPAVGDWIDHGAPAEYHGCWEAMQRLEDREESVVFREYGEHELARMRERRPEEFERLRDEGCEFFLASAGRD